MMNPLMKRGAICVPRNFSQQEQAYKTAAYCKQCGCGVSYTPKLLRLNFETPFLSSMNPIGEI
jgi:hypothetical protein